MTARHDHTRTALAAAVALLGYAAPAAAQQVLYTPLPPKGSAYVRFVNGLDGAAQLSPAFLPAQTLGAGTDDRVASYAVVEHVTGKTLTFDVTAGARTGHGSFTAAEGTDVTLMLRPDGASGIVGTPVVDNTDFNQTRAQITFYNDTAACAPATLKLLPTSAAVFANIAPGASGARAVPPVTATVVPSCPDGDGPPVPLQGLVAGSLYSIWLMQPAAQKLSFLSHNVTAGYKP